jgi:hypothetical protein
MRVRGGGGGRDAAGEVLLWELSVLRSARVGRPAHAASVLAVAFAESTLLLTYVRTHTRKHTHRESALRPCVCE